MKASIKFYYKDDILSFDNSTPSYGPAFGLCEKGAKSINYICLADKEMVEDLRNFLDYSLTVHNKKKNNPFKYLWVVFYCGEYSISKEMYSTAEECKEDYVTRDTPAKIFRVVRKIDETQLGPTDLLNKQ